MKKLLAVSGGVDSMVMLDWMLRQFSPAELLVAHFDHGIRPNSSSDADFVAKICRARGVECHIGRAQLGQGTSEAAARAARYHFLRSFSCPIYTAHHLDDLAETIAINFIRGTGWRGLAVFGADVHRPFLEDGLQDIIPDKRAIFQYAATHQLVFREDQTNSDLDYLRNRVRAQLTTMSRADKMQLYELWRAQTTLRRTIDPLIASLNDAIMGNRAAFAALPDELALELLRARVPATRPQLLDFLRAIRTYASGKHFNLPGDRLVKISRTRFEL